ncbi:hypothetical protein NDU88_003157 [Pleurodeles waltl]|uniref:Uncharacterized protein n=1 Tax=Pleurodeles waltl TaxID=8319 RepID=A0AAV7RHP5_PLEWA|nr:hypothetical protein NDU88_003157 [Pleurodeles waltl]
MGTARIFLVSAGCQCPPAPHDFQAHCPDVRPTAWLEFMSAALLAPAHAERVPQLAGAFRYSTSSLAQLFLRCQSIRDGAYSVTVLDLTCGGWILCPCNGVGTMPIGVGPTGECPGGTLESHTCGSTHDNPEIKESDKDARKRETWKRLRELTGQDAKSKKKRRDAESEEDAEKEWEDAEIRKMSIRSAGEAERVRETGSPPVEEESPGGTETTHACILDPTKYFRREEGEEGKEE